MKKFINMQIQLILIIFLISSAFYYSISRTEIMNSIIEIEESLGDVTLEIGNYYNLKITYINSNELKLNLINLKTENIKYSWNCSNYGLLILFDTVLYLGINLICIPFYLLDLNKYLKNKMHEEKIRQEYDVSIPNYSIGLISLINRKKLDADEIKNNIISFLFMKKYMVKRGKIYIPMEKNLDALKECEKYVLNYCIQTEAFEGFELEKIVISEGKKLGFIKEESELKEKIRESIEKCYYLGFTEKEVLIFTFLAIIIFLVLFKIFGLYASIAIEIGTLVLIYWIFYSNILTEKGKEENLKLKLLKEDLMKRAKMEELTEEEKFYYNILK